jgi:parallel beta-helix repeat protein
VRSSSGSKRPAMRRFEDKPDGLIARVEKAASDAVEQMEETIRTGVQAMMSMGLAVAGATLSKGATLKSNIASDWEGGFVVGETEGPVLTGNLARRNTAVAFSLSSPLSGAVLTKNTAIANGGDGFQMK